MNTDTTLEPLTPEQEKALSPEEIERRLRIANEIKLRELEGEPYRPTQESIQADMVQATLTDQKLSVNERIGSANSIQRYPMRAFVIGPDGSLSGDTALYEEVQQYDAEKGRLKGMW
jgi:hypothetical protein